MLLHLWQNLQLFENALLDRNDYRMYSTIVTEGLKFTMIPPDDNRFTDQVLLDIDYVRILPMSHKYNPKNVHTGLLIYSVDGQTDFILNDAMLRIKTGDVLIHSAPHILAGETNNYRELIRTLFGTHRVNLIGLVFTFSGNGEVSECMRWDPSSPRHTTPMHPTEKKLIEILLVSLYMNDAWRNIQVASHVDVESLSQSAKKQFLLKLANIEKVFHQRRKERQILNYAALGNIFRNHSSDNFRSFDWTPNRQQTFDSAVQGIFDQFYTVIQQLIPEGEFDRDQYAYFDDNTRQMMGSLATGYVPGAYATNPFALTPLQINPTIYSTFPRYF